MPAGEHDAYATVSDWEALNDGHDRQRVIGGFDRGHQLIAATIVVLWITGAYVIALAFIAEVRPASAARVRSRATVWTVAPLAYRSTFWALVYLQVWSGHRRQFIQTASKNETTAAPSSATAPTVLARVLQGRAVMVITAPTWKAMKSQNNGMARQDSTDARRRCDRVYRLPRYECHADALD